MLCSGMLRLAGHLRSATGCFCQIVIDGEYRHYKLEECLVQFDGYHFPQTTLSPSPDTLVMHHTLPLAWIADQWLWERCGLSPGVLRMIYVQLGASDPVGGSAVKLFADRLSGVSAQQPLAKYTRLM